MEGLPRDRVHVLAVAAHLVPEVFEDGEDLAVVAGVATDVLDAGLHDLRGSLEVSGAVAFERVSFGSGGVEGRHAPVHRTVARLDVVLFFRRIRELEAGARLAECAVGVLQADGHVVRVPRFSLREGDAYDGLNGLAAEQGADLDPPRCAVFAAREIVEGFDDRTLPRFDHQHHLADRDRQGLAHLARHEVGDLHGRLDELEVAAAGVGHAAQQGLVEVGADAEGAWS